ncbi:hypothetical protein ACIBQX_18790 [Nonomuraea sp. NPDC049714]|uniref:hypothetical protein n=1 Tax=Nonomuraea sp. NPDC049714 TaxID=3364357 RepID=UPI0037BA03BD
MPVSSKEELRVPHNADAIVYPVEIAIVLDDAGEPADSDYHAASWDGRDAVLLIGAGSDIPLDAGEYAVWTRLDAGLQRPVRRSGTLTVGTP